MKQNVLCLILFACAIPVGMAQDAAAPKAPPAAPPSTGLIAPPIQGNLKIITRNLNYKQGGKTFRGYFAKPANQKGDVPGILVVHEWWGHNQYARTRADMLAKLGYAALAVDMYGDGKTAKHPKDAKAFSGAVMGDIKGAKARFDAALKTLRAQPGVSKTENAAIGYCFGGGIVLNMARMGSDVKGVVSFHGMLGAKVKAKAGVTTAKVLVCHGAADKFIPQKDIDGIQAEMKAAGVDLRFESYPGALHGFTSKAADAKGKEFGIPLGYNATADARSWHSMLMFFGQLGFNQPARRN